MKLTKNDEYADLDNTDQECPSITLTINNQNLTITYQKYSPINKPLPKNRPTILDHNNQPLHKSQQTKIFKQLTKEINLPWVPNLYDLINYFPEYWVELLQNPPIIPNRPYRLYAYSRDIIKRKWPEAEPIILTDPLATYCYARDILKGRWKKAEPIILTDPWTAYQYATDIIKVKWKEAEPIILTNPWTACHYATDIIKGKWPQAEPIILKDPQVACYYKNNIEQVSALHEKPLIQTDKYIVSNCKNTL